MRIPSEHARRLDRAAFELRRPKQALVSELLERYVDPDSPASLAALSRPRASSYGGPVSLGADAGRRRVTVETLEPDAMVVGHHSFRPADPGQSGAAPEVLSGAQAGELLQVPRAVVERMAGRGELPGRKLGGEWRFSRAALLAWLAAPVADDDPGGQDAAR